MRVAIFISCISLYLTSSAQKDYTSFVNPFIGTGGHGHTFPGASMPFGMMQLSADTRMANWDGSSGYHYSDSVIYGFSHTHLSGTGIPDYCDVLVMPFSGNVQWKNEDYRSGFSHENEKAVPGYYEVKLDKHDIMAQFSTTVRAGMHQYTFPGSATEGSIIIDLLHRDKLLNGTIEVVNDHEIRGYRISKSWASMQTLYFHMEFDQPIVSDSFFLDKTEWGDGRLDTVKAALNFKLGSDNILKCKVGISAVSYEGAQLNLDTEIPGWDFERIRKDAQSAWNKELGKIEVSGGTKDQLTIFYTALYHTFLAPNIFQDVDGKFRGTDQKIHKADGFTNYTVFSLWDTYRAYHPLMTIINQQRTKDWIHTFLKQYEYGGMLPVWELASNETFCMIGYHSVPVIIDAYKKGIRDFDHNLALEAMTSYAESERFGLKYYRENGYLSNEMEHESVSKTLEYAYDDWCIAQFARWLDNDSVYKKYIRRAQYYKNVFDPSTGHMRGKIQGRWHLPFDPREINNFFTEGNSWQYSFAVPQDIETLIKLHKGKDEFAKKLDELFTTSSQTTGRDQADVTGLIGQYAHGNEPSHHMAYLFNYADRPWRTQELVQNICNDFYKNSPDGLIGNEDCGQMSAWYILSSMGFYPVTPGDGNYTLGIPLFDKVTIYLENGKSFTITTSKRNKGVNYVSEMKINGKEYFKSFLSHSDILNGGSFEFILGNRAVGKSLEAPSSIISEEKIVAVPFFDVASNKFRNEMPIAIKSIDPGVQIFYLVTEQGAPFDAEPLQYGKPFSVSQSSTIYAYAKSQDGKFSKITSMDVHRIPTDKSIVVLNEPHPMYTAGGPDALIDGIRGTLNWRTGEWQSYFGKDFEAIIDLKKERQVKYAGIHVLQDPSPWILYPKELIILASNDGTNFKEIVRIMNQKDQGIGTIETQEMGTMVNFRCRYIKFKALNAGLLPSWHESAGNPSHLFIDEIIVK